MEKNGRREEKRDDRNEERPEGDGRAGGRLEPIPEPERIYEAEKVESLPEEEQEKVVVLGGAKEIEEEVDRVLERRMDFGTEKEIEGRMEKEIDRELEGQMEKTVEREVEEELERQLSSSGTERVPGAPRKKVQKRVALRNREAPPGEAPAGGEGLANGRPVSLARGKGLRNRNGFVNAQSLSNGNGIVNGRKGIVNGRRVKKPAVNGSLVDAEGFYNGRGIVNGRGMVNGEGITNGRRMAIGEAPPRTRRSTGWIIGVVVLVVVLVALIIFFGLATTEKGIRVDGAFSDWSGAHKYKDDVADQSNPEINIEEYALSIDGAYASFYVKTEGKALDGRNNGMDSTYFFLDTDQNPATGYSIDSVGAEYVMIVDGYNGHVSACGLYRFQKEQSRPFNDWNARSPVGSCRAAAAGRELEAQLSLQDIGMQDRARMNVLFYARDGSGNKDYAPVIGTDRVSLRVVWSRSGPASVQPGATRVEMMRVELTASGGNVTVSSLRASANEATQDADLSRVSVLTATGLELPGSGSALAGGRATLRLEPPLDVPASGTTVLTVAVWLAPGAVTGKAIGLSLESAVDVAASTRAVTLEGRSLQMSYIGGEVPGRILIDGAFSDWDAYAGNTDPPGDVLDPNIDVTDFNLANDSSSLYFYIKVSGEMMGGIGIPELKLRPSGPPGGGGGGPVSLPVLVGEDALFIFIDTDSMSDTGYSGGGLPIGADYMVNITGQYGRITTQNVHTFTGGGDRGSWSWSAGAGVHAATDLSRLEGQVSLAGLGFPTGNMTVFYYTTDWKQKRDMGGPIAYDLRAQGGRGAAGEGTADEGASFDPGAGGREVWPLHAPEFDEILLPLAGTAVVFMLARRGRKGSFRIFIGKRMDY